MPETKHLAPYQFKSGDQWTGNPNGRPKGLSLTKILNETLAKDCGAGDGTTFADKLMDRLIGHAASGDAALLREIWNRVDGKVPDKVEQSGGVRIVVEYADDFAETPEAPCGTEGDPVEHGAV